MDNLPHPPGQSRQIPGSFPPTCNVGNRCKVCETTGGPHIYSVEELHQRPMSSTEGSAYHINGWPQHAMGIPVPADPHFPSPYGTKLAPSPQPHDQHLHLYRPSSPPILPGSSRLGGSKVESPRFCANTSRFPPIFGMRPRSRPSQVLQLPTKTPSKSLEKQTRIAAQQDRDFAASAEERARQQHVEAKIAEHLKAKEEAAEAKAKQRALQEAAEQAVRSRERALQEAAQETAALKAKAVREQNEKIWRALELKASRDEQEKKQQRQREARCKAELVKTQLEAKATDTVAPTIMPTHHEATELKWQQELTQWRTQDKADKRKQQEADTMKAAAEAKAEFEQDFLNEMRKQNTTKPAKPRLKPKPVLLVEQLHKVELAAAEAKTKFEQDFRKMIIKQNTTNPEKPSLKPRPDLPTDTLHKVKLHSESESEDDEWEKVLDPVKDEWEVVNSLDF
ncbi:hypothetical protein CC86DRAFT_434641 [Ophiobolus disseminans]|uniref:Uncharacterized protein n=1 Tax=Ophiobolus disseminans TaxID=1469910 RepID=A0A6A7ADF2_9PLEO|nr:hypothetical protein CC86DRAFT_434641 [Ophiobolus disseminans]